MLDFKDIGLNVNIKQKIKSVSTLSVPVASRTKTLLITLIIRCESNFVGSGTSNWFSETDVYCHVEAA